MRAIRVDPGQEPVEVQIGDEEEAMDSVVGGFAKQFHNHPADDGKRRLVYYSNADGARLKLLPNRSHAGTPIFGSILVVAVDVATAAEVDLSDREVQDAIRSFDAWSKIPQPAIASCTHPKIGKSPGGEVCLVCAKLNPFSSK